MSKKVHIKTFGCQMNVYDSERIGEALAMEGYEPTDQLGDADLVILNTCHIREKAAEKVYTDLGRIRDMKMARQSLGRDTVVAVAGCVAQAEGAEIARRAPVVDLIVGSQSYHHLPDLLARLRNGERHIVETQFPETEKFAALPPQRAPRATTAFLTVQEGCDKFCTFCVVPYTRGAEFSRSPADLEAETRRLVDRGVREITLLGQNVNAYHGAEPDGQQITLAGLIRRLARIEGLDRLRYMTSHPRDMGDDLIDAHRSELKLMPYLHLPVQSGADRILAAMNRKHTAAEYLKIIERVRNARPDIAISTDLIVGFPGESDKEFEASLDIVRSVGFAQAYSFKYSPRPGTPAASIADQVPEDVKTERLARLQELLESQQVRFNADCVGKMLPVLFDKRGRHQGQLVGRTPYLQLVHATAADSDLGRILTVEISSAGTNSLSGVIRAA